MFRRRKKLYFQNTVSKFPTVIFIASIIIGGFFLVKIIATLVNENEGVDEIASIETQNKTGTVSSPKEVIQKTAESSKPAVKTPQVSGFYTIQVATFADMKRTENLINQLKGSNYSPIYIKTRDHLFEVCVGKFSDSKEGQEVLSKIRKSFRDAFIRKMQSPFEEK